MHDIQEFSTHSAQDNSATKLKNEKAIQKLRAKFSNLPPSPEQQEENDDNNDEEEEGGSRNSREYYILHNSASSTPRFEMLLDQRGGNWVDVSSASQSHRRRQRGEDDDDNGVNLEDGDEEEERNIVVDSDEFDIDDQIEQRHRQRAITMGLNILIQRNADSVFSDMRTLDIDDASEDVNRERRRRGHRGRVLSNEIRDRYERFRQLTRSRQHRNRVSRRLSHLTRSFAERREYAAVSRLSGSYLTENNNNNDEEEDAPDPREGRPSGSRNNADDNRSFNEHNDEIRRLLQSLRRSVDMVTENLNSVRRQLDLSVVESGVHFDRSPHRLYMREDLRSCATFHKNYSSEDPYIRHVYAQQRPRLTHYIVEPNVGQGFIKELCFSADGRLICSPYKQGIRLLAFDNKCAEMSHCLNDHPTKLVELSRISGCHRKSVVSTKFSPTHLMLVSGCLDGKISWHHPVL